MVEIITKQSEVDRLRAENAELIWVLRRVADSLRAVSGRTGAVVLAEEAIAKATNQEAGQ